MRALPAVISALIACLLLAMPLRAEDPVETTRNVIAQQIDAFLKDDADKAYSFAAPGIRARYPDKDAFLAMVRKSYEPVYRPGNYAFGRSRMVGNGALVLHEVMISGRDGRNWRAIYQLLLQGDGSYKIGGVMVMPDRVSKGI